MNVAVAPDCRAPLSATQWQSSCDIAALYRLVAHFRMTDLIYTHISARLRGPDHHILINQYGVMFNEMRGAAGMMPLHSGSLAVHKGAADLPPLTPRRAAARRSRTAGALSRRGMNHRDRR